MSKTFRAVHDGFYDGKLVLANATFDAHDDFNPNWAVEVDDHPANASNSGDQETLSQAIAPALPELQSAAPLPEFHPAIAVPTASSETEAALAAQNDRTDTPVVRTADTVSTSDPAKAAPSRRAPRAKDAAPEATPTEPSEAEKADAKAASAAETAEQHDVDNAKSDDLI